MRPALIVLISLNCLPGCAPLELGGEALSAISDASALPDYSLEAADSFIDSDQSTPPDLLPSPDVAGLDLRCTGRLQVAPVTMPFGNVNVARTVPPINVTVGNSGECNLTINTFTLGGAQPADFSLDWQVVPPVAMGGGVSFNVKVYFIGQSPGARSATLDIRSNDPNTPLARFPVTANGVVGDPAIQVTPGNIPFGNVPVGMASGAQSVKVQNNGIADLHLASVTITGADAMDFALDTLQLATTLPMNTASTLKVLCLPSVKGARAATLQITSDDPNLPVETIALSCTGA